MPSKKSAHLQQFGIIHLLNLNLTNIRNLREEQNYVIPFYLLKNLHQDPRDRNKIIFMSPRIPAHIYVSVEGKYAKLFCQIIYNVFPKLDRCQPKIAKC
jgi:hypothetical protein